MMQSIVSNHKRLSLALAFCLSLGHSFTIPCSAQNYFNKRIDLTTANKADRLYSILEVSDGYVMTGLFRNSGDVKTLLMAKVDFEGNYFWTKSYGDGISGETYSYPGSFIKFNASKYFTVSSWRVYNKKNRKIDSTDRYLPGSPLSRSAYRDREKLSSSVWDRGRLICYNSCFDTLWSRFYGDLSTPHDTAYLFNNMCKTNDQKIIITGIKYTDAIPNPIILLKTDSLGNKLWEKSYGNTGNDIYQGFSVIQASDGGYAIGGHKYAPGEFGDPLVIKTDSLGNQEWMLNFGGPYQDNKAMVCPAHDGTIICGTALATGMVSPDMAWARINIGKIANDGSVLWNKLYGTDRMDNFLLNIRPTPDSGFIACGQVVSKFPHYVGWLLKINRNGDSLWYREYDFLLGEYGMHQLDDVIATSDKGYFSSGYLTPLFLPDTGSVDTWLVKVDSLGCEGPDDCWVGIHPPAPPSTVAAAGKLSLQPNPATTETLVSWQGEAVRIEVFSGSGHCLFARNLTATDREFRLSLSAFAPGLVLLRLHRPDGTVSHSKLLIIPGGERK